MFVIVQITWQTTANNRKLKEYSAPKKSRVIRGSDHSKLDAIAGSLEKSDFQKVVEMLIPS